MAKIKCELCNKEFERDNSNIKRSKRLGRSLYCSTSCNAKGNKNRYNIGQHNRNGIDEYSPFRIHLIHAEKHMKNRKGEVSVTLQDLKELWDKQDGICPYTGWKLKNRTHTGQKLALTPDRASLDRIDSSKGYTKNNVQFVAYMYNICKNSFEHEEVVKFVESFKNN